MKEIPFSIQWPIAENRLLTLKDSINGCLNSTPVTNNPEFEYFLRIYPNGDSDGGRGQTWIFLHLKLKNVNKVEVDCTFTIESANKSKVVSTVYERSTGWGRCVRSTEKFFDPAKKFIVDRKFNVKVDGIFKFEVNGALPAAIQQKWIGGAMGDEFWERNDNKDFAIIIGDKEIKIHKLVLDIRSEVFGAMLKSNMNESIENKVTITDFSFNVVETAFKIIYECNFTSALTLDEIMELQRFFDKYLLPAFKAKVEPFLISQISASNVVRLTNASIETNSSKLKAKCMEFLSTAFAAKTPLTDFDDLDKDTLYSIIKSSFCQTLEIEEQ